MKQCPECNRTYPDDTLAFCLADGALLSAPYIPGETLRLSTARTTNPPPTEILPSQQGLLEGRRSNSKIIYTVIALMSIVIVTLVGIIITPRMLQENNEKNDVSQPPVKLANEPTKAESLDPANVRTQGSSSPNTAITNANQSHLDSSLTSALTGSWQGQWSSPYGTAFSARVY